MPMRRLVYTVYLQNPEEGGEPVEHEVQVLAVDRLKAELEAGRQKLPAAKDAPQNHTALWLWCALVRTKVVKVTYQQFKNDQLLDFDPIREEEPDPTPADPSA